MATSARATERHSSRIKAKESQASKERKNDKENSSREYFMKETEIFCSKRNRAA